MPSSHAIAATLGTLLIINVYAPSGTTKHSEREAFFNNDLPFLLGSASEDLLMGGDFNCVLKAADSNEHGPFSRALATLAQGYALSDVWQARYDSNGSTHYTIHGVTRIDWIYLSSEMLAQKTRLATVPAAFTDHLAVVLRLAWRTSIIR